MARFDINNRNMNGKNFSLGNRDMARALINANNSRPLSLATRDTQASGLRDYVKYLKSEHGLKDLKQIELTHNHAYLDNLIERYEAGSLTAGTVQDYISYVNNALEIARGDRAMVISAVDNGAPRRCGIADRDHSVSQQTHDAVKQQLPDRLSAQADLQREIGLRFKESCLINVREVLAHAEKTGNILITDGTKGGRPREFAVVSQSQIHALERALQFQGSHYSLVPVEQSFAQYQNECYRAIQQYELKFHGERHHYANERYFQISGVNSPVRAGVEHEQHHRYIAEQLGITITQARQLDHETRLQIAEELGHSRIDITNAYLG